LIVTMAIKPNASTWTVIEQIVEDPASGLTLQFSVTSAGEFRLTVCSDTLPFANRDFVFGTDGKLEGTGTGTKGPCPPGWMRTVKPAS
jgi:hypothetical protein